MGVGNRAERMDPVLHLSEKRHEHKARLEWAVTTGCGSWPSRLDSTESARSARSASCGLAPNPLFLCLQMETGVTSWW